MNHQYKRLTIAVCLSVIFLPALPAHSQSGYDPAARVKNAQELLAQTNQYRIDSQRLHRRVQNTIEIAERLKGEASDLEIKVDESKIAPHLRGGQLQAAQAQYAGDVRAFQTHAQDYANHLQQFHVTLGECSANARQYQSEVQKYELHTAIFHVPNIKPPHICHALNLAQRDSARIANEMVSDQQRLAQAEQDLSDEQSRLSSKIAQVPALQNQVLNENRRALEEKKLAGEFARLKDEYETLSIEHAALTGKNGSSTVVSQTVSGKIKSHKSR